MKTGAERMRLYRARERRGLLYAPAWVEPSLVEFFIDRGILTAEQAKVPAEVADALVKWGVECAGDALLRARKFV